MARPKGAFWAAPGWDWRCLHQPGPGAGAGPAVSEQPCKGELRAALSPRAALLAVPFCNHKPHYRLSHSSCQFLSFEIKRF